MIGSWLMRSRSRVALTVALSVDTSGVISFTSTAVAVAPGVSEGSMTTRSATRTVKAPSNFCIPGDCAERVYVPGATEGKM